MAKKEEERKTLDFSVVGLKQVLRELDSERIETVYLAKDADPEIRNTVLAKCRDKEVTVETVPTMKELGQLAGIEVKAAVAGIFKESLG